MLKENRQHSFRAVCFCMLDKNKLVVSAERGYIISNMLKGNVHIELVENEELSRKEGKGYVIYNTFYSRRNGSKL